MDIRLGLLMGVLMLSGCASQALRCGGRMQPINAPAVNEGGPAIHPEGDAQSTSGSEAHDDE